TPIAKIATPIAAASRHRPGSIVRHIARTVRHHERRAVVRQTELDGRNSERVIPARTRPATQPPHAAIAAAVRRERERAGLSLTELARRAGVAKSTLSRLESGTANPSVETLWALGVAL